jgi:sirohydrochlorin ferrochelatase
MKTLIILAHGSRREESNLEIKTLAEKVKALAGTEYHLIEYAYLEMVEPSLSQTIDNSIDNGATKITVFPYFLNSGNHVKRDIPEMIKKARVKYPGCLFNVSDCIGMIEDMPKLILEQARLS